MVLIYQNIGGFMSGKSLLAFEEDMSQIKKIFGFTLVEVLITLGIIGVVAALTIPNLMTAHKKHKIEAKLTKAVSTINQIIKQSETENGEMETWDNSLTPVEYLNKYITPYAKVSQLCEGQGSCGYPDVDKVYKYINGTHGYYYDIFTFGRTPFILQDGTLFAWGTKNSSGDLDNKSIIIIDINGSEKPNQFGQDTFFLQRKEEEDAIIPYGAGKSQNELRADCKKGGAGFYCAELIRENGWKIPSGYPLL